MVWMILLCEFVKCGLQFRRSGCARYTEDFVVVAHTAAAARRRRRRRRRVQRRDATAARAACGAGRGRADAAK